MLFLGEEARCLFAAFRERDALSRLIFLLRSVLFCFTELSLYDWCPARKCLVRAARDTGGTVTRKCLVRAATADTSSVLLAVLLQLLAAGEVSSLVLKLLYELVVVSDGCYCDRRQLDPFARAVACCS